MTKDQIINEYEFEIIENGEVIDVVTGWDELDRVYDALKEKAYSTPGYAEVNSCFSGSWGYALYFNVKQMSTIIVGYRSRFAHIKGIDGKPIYHDCSLIDLHGQICTVNKYAFKNSEDKPFYKTFRGDNSRIDIDADEISEMLRTKFDSIPFNGVKPKF